MDGQFVDRGGLPTPVTGIHESKIVDAIADWCDALHGTGALEDAFAALASGLGAEAAMLVRTHQSDDRPMRVAVWDRLWARSSAPLQTSFADGYFGDAVKHPRASSIWLASAHEFAPDDDPDPALGIWQARRKMTEYVVLVLAGGPVSRDHIELHFANGLPRSALATLAAVLPMMARTWASRQVGLVTRNVINHRLAQDMRRKDKPRVPLLSSANPARLSRAEFRVCLLLSRGLSILGVADELAISDSTVRSHLRSIYAKTETSGLADLVFNLMKVPNRDDTSDLRYA